MAAKDIWVFVENGGSGLELLAPARELAASLGGTACALTPDGGQAEECAACGAGHVLILDGAENAPARALAPSLAGIIGERSPAAALFASTDMGRELAVRIARRLGSGFVADAEGFEADGSGGIVWSKSVFGGETRLQCRCDGEVQIAAIRQNTFKKAAAGGADAGVEHISCAAGRDSAAELLDVIMDAADEMPGLDGAEIVVAGGMGAGGEEGFKLLAELAGLLGGTVGASRAATDEGWISTSQLVGQTGKIIAPKLYIACGISGALQHVCGMSGSDVIVAINKDAGAPIFKVADYGVVGDMHKIIPALIAEIKKARA